MAKDDTHEATTKDRALSITQTIVVTVITVIITAVLNLLSDYLTQDRGGVRFSAPSVAGQKTFVTVDILNYSREFIDDLVLSVPSSVNLAELSASRPVQIYSLTNSVGTNRAVTIKVSAIQPKAQTRLIFVSSNSMPDSAEFAVVNAAQKRVATDVGGDFETPNVRLLKKAIVTSLLYGVLYFLFLLYVRDQNIKERKMIGAAHAELLKIKEESRAKTAEMEERLKGLEKNHEDRLRELRRVRMAIATRLTAAMKELDFWRDTIRKMLYGHPKGKDAAENIIKGVTGTLKTYEAQGRFQLDPKDLEYWAESIFEERDERANLAKPEGDSKEKQNQKTTAPNRATRTSSNEPG